MTFRTKSRGGQWAVWFGAALVALAAYVILSRAFYGTFSWNLLVPRQFRLAAPLLALLIYIARETRWDGIVREEEEGKAAPPPPVQSPTSSAAVRCPTSSVPTPAPDATLAFSDSGVARAEKDRQIPSAGVVAGSENAKSAYRESDLRSQAPTPADPAAAARLWAEARAMTHRFIPDPEKDADYLAKLHGAANLGHLEAMAKLGDYAFRRKAYVEAYYWTALADLKGATGLEEPLRKIKAKWLARGCPTQRGNVSLDFTEQQGSFARALLRIRCAVDTPTARARMRELADQGLSEAQLFLKR